jgi:hypothetical protein
MIGTLELLLRTTGLGLGLLLLYIAFFLYENEEGRLQNSLEELWIRVADRSDTTSIAVGHLAKEAARLTSHALDRIFGRQLLSRRAVGVSFFYGAASIAVYPIVLYSGPTIRGAIWLIPMIFLVLGSLPALFGNQLTTRIVFLPTVAFVAFFLCATLQVGWLIADNKTQDFGIFAMCGSVTAALITAIACDFGWIVLARKMFNWANEEMSLRRIVGLILVNLTALVFGLAPLLWRALFTPPFAPPPARIFVEMFFFYS